MTKSQFFSETGLLDRKLGFCAKCFPSYSTGSQPLLSSTFQPSLSTGSILFSSHCSSCKMHWKSIRWVMVYFPDKSEKIFSRHKSKSYIAICWILPVIFILPSWTGLWDWHALDCRTRTCTIVDDPNDAFLSYKKILILVGVVLPSLVLVITNFMIYAKVL